MFEALKAYPTLYIIVIFLAYLAGGATMFVAISHWLFLKETKETAETSKFTHPSHRMELDEDRDAIGEALEVFAS